MTLSTLAGLSLGAILALSVLFLGALLLGWCPRLGVSRPGGRDTVTRWFAMRHRIGAAVLAGALTAVATRWPVAVLAVAALVLVWPRLFGAGAAASGQIQRLEALATWTESLRDSIAGSVGLEEAIRHSRSAAPPILGPHLERLEGRLRVQIPLTQALNGLAEDLEDPSADLVVAALVLNSRLRGPGLVATLTALATSTREELDLRRRIEEGRRALRRTALIILGATGLFAGGLAVFSRTYVAPYSTPTGQVVLAVVLAVFAAGLWWIRSAAQLRTPQRFLSTAAADGGVRG